MNGEPDEEAGKGRGEEHEGDELPGGTGAGFMPDPVKKVVDG